MTTDRDLEQTRSRSLREVRKANPPRGRRRFAAAQPTKTAQLKGPIVTLTAVTELEAELEAEFDLDLQVLTDGVPEAYTRCGTNDGCDPTCASACTSRV